jgi:hypothetical protein
VGPERSLAVAAPLPRIVRRRASPGYIHALSRRDVVEALRALGEEYFYGLRAIELVQPPPERGPGLALGRLRVPGTILLFAQPEPPWTLSGRLSPDLRARLERAGALLNDAASGQTVAEWPDGTLRDFMLFDVFAHELAHHVLQQYKGKRGVRIARTKDHEAFADLTASRMRAALGSEK